jgi:hypothetical protein
MPDPPMPLIRPGTLAEIQRLVRAEGETFRFCLAGFLAGITGAAQLQPRQRRPPRGLTLPCYCRDPAAHTPRGGVSTGAADATPREPSLHAA